VTEERQGLGFGQPTLTKEVLSQEIGIWFSTSMVVDRPKLLVCWRRPYGLWDLRKERHELGSEDR
jgi:hypothetical protein